jgi:hypothetical protein
MGMVGGAVNCCMQPSQRWAIRRSLNCATWAMAMRNASQAAARHGIQPGLGRLRPVPCPPYVQDQPPHGCDLWNDGMDAGVQHRCQHVGNRR